MAGSLLLLLSVGYSNMAYSVLAYPRPQQRRMALAEALVQELTQVSQLRTLTE